MCSARCVARGCRLIANLKHRKNCFLYLPDGELPIKRIKIGIAIDLATRGMATFFDGHRCLRITARKSAAPSDNSVKSDQGWVYEKAAVTAGARFVQGGLCRNEHKPGQIDKFQGAKVGHQ